MTLIRLVAVFGALTLSTSAGINWRTVWMEPNPVVLQPKSSISYVVKGINGMGDAHEDLTHNPYLRITSTDDSIVAVDQASARLIAKSAGRVEVRVSFSECTSLITATVRGPQEIPNGATNRSPFRNE